MYRIIGCLVVGLDYCPVYSRTAIGKGSAELMLSYIKKTTTYVGVIIVRRGSNEAIYMKKEDEWFLVEVNGKSLI